MGTPVIKVEGLSKEYVIGLKKADDTFRDMLTSSLVTPFHRFRKLRGQVEAEERFWALKDVSFEVHKGDVVGIIGRNGAGKSTLLKILSRITAPTKGKVLLRGRVASLLEIGTGFHPELTGRENIYLNGSILGMNRAEIKRKFEEIVAFSEIETFLDTPVKRYSSGMYVRLAFAVAAHLEPEILVVDEVLAVGDAEFQKKCLGRMGEVARGGRTVLFVSHNLGAITSLCPLAIWLDRGAVQAKGSSREVVDKYLTRAISDCQLVPLGTISRPPYLYDDRIRLQFLEWLSPLPLRHGERLRARIGFKVRAPIAEVSIGIGFSSLEGRRLLSYDTDFQDNFRPSFSGPLTSSVIVDVDSLPLGPDVYSLDIGCRSGEFHGGDYLPSCIQVEVIGGPKTPGIIFRKNSGVRLKSGWSWSGLSADGSDGKELSWLKT